MKYFLCPNCNNKHEFSTLIEFPTPEIISKISSGKLNEDLELIGKNLYKIGKSQLIMQSDVEIEIHDFDDNLDMLIWSEVDVKEFVKNYHKNKKSNRITVDGKIIHPIPFYDKTEDLTIKLEIKLDKNENGKLIEVMNHIEFNKDLRDGIMFKKLIKFYGRICKLTNKK